MQRIPRTDQNKSTPNRGESQLCAREPNALVELRENKSTPRCAAAIRNQKLRQKMFFSTVSVHKGPPAVAGAVVLPPWLPLELHA